MITSAVLLCLFYGICIYAVLCSGGVACVKRVFTRISKAQVFTLIVSLCLFFVIIVYWVLQDRYIYFWDYSGYWKMSIDRIQFLKSNSAGTILSSLLESINYSEYNIFLPTLVAFPLSILGCTFKRYVVACCTFFLLPALFVQSLAVTKMIDNKRLAKGRLFVISFIASMLSTSYYYVAFRGYVDVAYLLPMAAVMYLLVDYDFSIISHNKNIALSLLLVLIWISRRYTIYFIIGVVVALVVKAVWTLVEARELIRIKSVVIDFVEIGGISLGILFIFFRHFILNALLANYGEIYSAYDCPLPQKINGLQYSFGGVTFTAIALVGVACIASRKQLCNYAALLSMILVEIVILWQTQNMDIHHRMILSLPIFLIVMLAFEQARQAYDAPKWKKYLSKILVYATCMLMILNFSKAFVPKTSTRGCGRFYAARYQPLRRDDIHELNILADKMNALTAGTDYGIYVLASGHVLNSDILRNLALPESNDAIPSMYRTNDVDLVSGFPTDFLAAKYVVTTDPLQTHLGSGQEVVTYLADKVNDSESYIGRHYELLDQVELGDGVVAKIYNKQSDFESSDLQMMSDYYMDLYPEYGYLFADRLVTYMK